MMKLSELRPLSKVSVYDLLEKLNFDLSSWAVSDRGKPISNPAVNGRAYAWSFEDKRSGQHAFMLWHEEMTEVDGKITYFQDWRDVLSELERTRPITAGRADDFLRHVSRVPMGTVVWVGVVEGSRAKTSDEESSRVARRVLDESPWHISYWDPITSTYEFTRGLPDTSGEPAAVGQEEAVSTGLFDKFEGDIKEIIESDRSQTEKVRLISARLGQGKFRSELLAQWGNACAVTGSTTHEAIRSSHCKPWRSANDEERLNPKNGLPLVATLDALFDVGLISFENSGRIMISSQLDDSTLSLSDLELRRALEEEEIPFLEYHRREIFQK